MEKEAKIYIAGHKGLVGSALLRVLQEEHYANLVYRRHEQLDLCDAAAVDAFFAQERPEYVFLAAARVGGIGANDSLRADFLRENLLIQTHVIGAASRYKVRKLLFLGSSCIYPKFAQQPIGEHELLNGKLEATNEAYAIAKIAGILLCQSYNHQYGTNFHCVMPTNLYGPGDNYDLDNSHVLPALIRKFHEAKQKQSPEVVLWGSGKAKREFLYSDDLARACLLLMQTYHFQEKEIINIGSGEELSIHELALKIKKLLTFPGKICYDPSRPDGSPRKLLDSRKIRSLGWRPQYSLEEGLEQSYRDFLQGYAKSSHNPAA